MTFLYDFYGPMTSTVIICSVLCVFFIILSFFIKKVDPYKKTPMWMVPFLWIVDLVNGFVKENIGIRWKAYAPWFLTLVIFIFFANISSVYLLDNPTSYIVVTAALAFTSLDRKSVV